MSKGAKELQNSNKNSRTKLVEAGNKDSFEPYNYKNTQNPVSDKYDNKY
jgi:hypothetical protein